MSDNSINKFKVSPSFSAKALANMAYYKGVDVASFIQWELNDKESLIEVITEMSKLLVSLYEEKELSRITNDSKERYNKIVNNSKERF